MQKNAKFKAAFIQIMPLSEFVFIAVIDFNWQM